MQGLGYADRGCLQSIERGVPAGGEFTLTSLAEEILNGLVPAMMAVTDQGMDGRVRDPDVIAIGVGTGVTLGVECLLAAGRAFALGIGGYGFRGSW
jgi:hypothetical protein